MIKKKNRFLAFCFSCFPGAGHMYMGFMKQGTMLMATFFGMMILDNILRINIGIYASLIIWFISFFDGNNKASLTEEEFYSLEDEYWLGFGKTKAGRSLAKKEKLVVAIILIALGLYSLWRGMTGIVFPNGYSYGDSIYWRVLNRVPQVVCAVGIIILGILLIKGKKESLDKDVVEASVVNAPVMDKPVVEQLVAANDTVNTEKEVNCNGENN